MAKRIPLIILLWLGTDLYFFQALQTLAPHGTYTGIYWLIDLFLIGGITAVIFVGRGTKIQQTLIAWLMGLMLLVLIPRL